MVDPHRMMRKYDPAEGFTQPLVHAWFVGVNINAIRCTQHDACITLVGWCAQPLAYAWRAWVNATATRCRGSYRQLKPERMMCGLSAIGSANGAGRSYIPRFLRSRDLPQAGQFSICSAYVSLVCTSSKKTHR